MNYDNINIDIQETDFQPLTRGRAYTWHGPGYQPQTDYQHLNEEELEEELLDTSPDEKNSPKKLTSSRRNAWGNMSYSDLIMQAIESSEEKRLSLVQIYNWMIEHVPYFQERSDGSSSVGWKNSIRHNLSLHPQFMRQPNDKTGKSSWWIINHSAIKPSRSRRTNIISEFSKNKYILGSNILSQGQPCVSISEGDETDMLHSYLPTATCSSFRKRTFSNPSPSSNLTTLLDSELQRRMQRTTTDEIDDARATSNAIDLYKSKPLLHHPEEMEKIATKKMCYQELAQDDEESRKELEWFIPSGQFELLNKKSEPLSPTTTTSLDTATSIPEVSIKLPKPLSEEEAALEKALLFQLMKSEKITKLRQRNPEFERRICEAIRKKKSMILMQQQQQQQQQQDAASSNFKPNLNHFNFDSKRSSVYRNLFSDVSAKPSRLNEDIKTDSNATTILSDSKQTVVVECPESEPSSTAENLMVADGTLPQFSTDFESLLQLGADNLLEGILGIDMASISDFNYDLM